MEWRRGTEFVVCLLAGSERAEAVWAWPFRLWSASCLSALQQRLHATSPTRPAPSCPPTHCQGENLCLSRMSQTDLTGLHQEHKRPLLHRETLIDTHQLSYKHTQTHTHISYWQTNCRGVWHAVQEEKLLMSRGQWLLSLVCLTLAWAVSILGSHESSCKQTLNHVYLFLPVKIRLAEIICDAGERQWGRGD